MTKKYAVITAIMLTAAVVLAGLYTIPIYSVSEQGCLGMQHSVHSSLLSGATKDDVDSSARSFVSESSKYDCPVDQVRFGLYVF